MKEKLARAFLLLAIGAAMLWIFGIVVGAVIPLFGGIRAETAGAVLFAIALASEGFVYLFAWLYRKLK